MDTSPKLTWHFPWIHISRLPGLHRVPSCTRFDNWTITLGSSSPVYRLPPPASGISGSGKCSGRPLNCRKKKKERENVFLIMTLLLSLMIKDTFQFQFEKGKSFFHNNPHIAREKKSRIYPYYSNSFLCLHTELKMSSFFYFYVSISHLFVPFFSCSRI